MKEVQKKILEEDPKEHVMPDNVPSSLNELVKEVQELVYFRTLRTDALYELYYLAGSIFSEVEAHLGIDSVKDYLPDDLLAGKLKRIPHEYAIIKYDDGVIVTDSFVKQDNAEAQMLRGTIAQKGIATGTVKVIYTPAEIGKIEAGDILVTNMTIPAYITAMHKASAFVTDEGGITCHAAIIAREMKKPCVIGTKIATKVFQDGDIVEVDANSGIVKKII